MRQPPTTAGAPPAPSNGAIADAFDELADLYELDGAVVHRVQAYRTAARAVRESSLSVATLALAGRATELDGIGTTLQEKILALAETGAIPAAERLRAKYPPGLVAITRLPGIGAKRARLLYEELGIDSPEALRQAALQQRLRTVRGLGPKFEATVIAALQDGVPERTRVQLLLPAALELGETIAEALRAHGPPDARVQLAGSARRLADTVSQIDLVGTSADPAALARCLAELEPIERARPATHAGARGRTHSGVPVELHTGPPGAHPNLLQHFTGSAAHNAALAHRALRAGLELREHGVARDGDRAIHACASEPELYALLGLAHIPPELREDRGELDAAAAQGAAGAA
ncbi:MAG: helix-hairpin-helix domain-containing protein, partial [Solirubrobacterales bacterium]|nr:helix-hairpin-helix domain-containing protein [Solirubrobacterales bacterium]